MNSPIHPIFVIAALGLAASVVLLITVFRVRRVGLKVLLVFLAVVTLTPTGLVLMAMHPEWMDGRYRSYKAFYAEIQLGMTRDEVMAVQAKLYPENGPRKKPRIITDDAGGLTFFMDPEDPESSANCEAILLAFKEGKVSTKTYSPD